ncbi:MAG: murein biosynthesis integral membrane protein MurJ [Candidatus Lindowbacteria bacterium]|nr:murein biosynthesis integral membrane protein MurJ [Candidatus Lindowbacteria bacterium]
MNTEKPTKQKNRLGRNALSMGVGVGLSRITGLLRVQMFAFLFGSSFAMDAFVVAFRIPNFLRDLLAENVTSSALVPVYTSVREKEGKEEAANFAGAALALFITIGSLMCVLGILFAPQIIKMVAPGFPSNTELFSLTVTLTRILFPFIVLISIAAFFQSIQNAEGRFFVPAVSSAVLNLVFMGTGWFLSKNLETPIIGMAIGALLGGVASILVLFPGYYRSLSGKVGVFAFWKFRQIKELLFMLGPLVIGVAAVNINLLVNTIAASFAEPGAMAFLNYAYRVMHLPLGLIAVTLSTAAIPLLAKAHASGGHDEYVKSLGQALSYCILLAFPATLGLGYLRSDIVGVLFNYGSFTSSDLTNTSLALLAYTVGIPALALNRIFSASYYSRKETKAPVAIGAIGVTINIVLNVYVIIQGMGFAAIATATSVAGWTQTIIYVFFLASKYGRPLFGSLVTPVLRCVIGSILMLLALWGVSSLGIENRLIRVVAEILAGAAAYGLVAIRKP